MTQEGGQSLHFLYRSGLQYIPYDSVDLLISEGVTQEGGQSLHFLRRSGLQYIPDDSVDPVDQ